MLRMQKGMSQEKLAEAAGLHWTFISRIERGMANITLDNLERLAQALEVDEPALVAPVDYVGHVPEMAARSTTKDTIGRR